MPLMPPTPPFRPSIHTLYVIRAPKICSGLKMEAEAAEPLFEQILIKTKFDDNVDEVRSALLTCN